MINTPSSIPLPEELQKATEQAQNNLTLANAEVQRLTKLQSQINRDIVNLATNKSNLETSILVLQSQSDKLTSDNATLQENIKIADKQLQDIKSEEALIQSSIKARDEDLSARVNALSASKEQHIKDTYQLNSDRTAFESDKQAFESKKSMLKEVLDKL
jgi:chromosome segregation ATPase